MIWWGAAEQGRRDAFGVCEEGVVGVEVDGRVRDVDRSKRLVKLPLRFDHFGGLARERGEVCVHGDNGGTKPDIGAHREECRENPEGRRRGEEEEQHGGGSAEECEREEQRLPRRR